MKEGQNREIRMCLTNALILLQALRQQYEQIQDHQVSSMTPVHSSDAQFLMQLLEDCHSRRNQVTLPGN